MVENRSGVFLRVNEWGRVDFTPIRDSAAIFIMEHIPNSAHMHLLPE